MSLGCNTYDNSLGKGLFYDCPLQSVFVGRNLSYTYTRYYGYSPFAYVQTLEKIRFGNPVTSIPQYILYHCKVLTKVAFNEKCKLETVGDYAFSNCLKLAVPAFPATVTSFGANAFEKCVAFTDFDMPDALKSISDYSFSGCEALTTVTLPASVTTINYEAFGKCTALTDVYCYAEKVPTTNKNAFLDTNIANVTLHVPGPSISLYEVAEPWKNFKGMTATPENPDMPDAPKCATPTIKLENGELSFSCDTEDVQFVATVSSADTKTHYASRVGLTATYTVSVYATKTGYNKSETATMDISLNMDKKGDVNGDGKVTIQDAVKVVNLILNEGTDGSKTRKTEAMDEQTANPE